MQFARVQEDGSVTLRQFATGFRRPVDVAVGAQTGVFVADAERGVIYRIGAPLVE